MDTKNKYPTPGNYPALIEKALPALRALLDEKNTDYDMDYYNCYCDDYCNRVGNILRHFDLDVINTVCVIMVIGRQSLYQARRKPYKAPEMYFIRWAKDLWTFDSREKDSDISYISGKKDLARYLAKGTHLLKIKLKGETYAG